MTASRSLLLVRPVLNSHGDPKKDIFEVSSFSLGLLIKQRSLKTNKYRVIDLALDKAKQGDIEEIIGQNDTIDFIVFLGHGVNVSEYVQGYNREKLFEISKGLECTEGKGLYFVCCYASATLGKMAVNNFNAKFFLGFDSKVYLIRNASESIVAECLLTGLFALMDGKTIDDAYSEMLFFHLKKIEELEREQDNIDPDWFVSAGIIRKNLQALERIPN